MPDAHDLPLPEFPEDDEPASDDIDLPEYYHMEGDDDEDVPFHLPRSEDEEDDYLLDDEDDETGDIPVAGPNVMPTIPVYRRPGEGSPPTANRFDADATLPGTGGLDPNPDAPDRPAAHTMKHQAVRLPQNEQNTVPHPVQGGQTVPSQPAEDSRYQRPRGHNQVTQGRGMQHVPPPPPGQGVPGKGARPLPPRRKRRRGMFGFRPGCIWIFLGSFITVCGGMFCLVAAISIPLAAELEARLSEQVAQVDDYRGFQSTFYYDRNGTPLFEAFGEGRRVYVPYERFPRHLINATVAIEDDSFWTNPGFDFGATMVAFFQYIGADAGTNTPGGSTITQQLVRGVLFAPEYRSERSVQRKVEEIVLAVILTNRRSKQDILEMYLNEIYYGNLAYGAQVAAQTFFGVDVEDLTLGQAALLAGLPQAPAELDPLNPDPAVQQAVYDRWRQVLDEMYEEGYITLQERNDAFAEGLSFVPQYTTLRAPHFTVYAQRETERIMNEIGYTTADVAQGGWRIYTTVDLGINDMVQQTVRDQVASLANSGRNVSNGAALVIQPITGEIFSMVGSIDYNSETIDGRVNVAISLRQPGSTMKPFTYSAAMERGMTPGDIIWDVPTSIGIPGQPQYEPRNYDGRFHGPMRMRTALANSYNIPAVQTLRLIGVDYLLSFMGRLGVESFTGDASQYGLSLTLGGGEISLVELTNAYAVFANQGVYVPVTSILCIVDSDGVIVYQYESGCPEGTVTERTVSRSALGQQALDPRVAFIITDILSDEQTRSEAMGSRSALYTQGIASAVKTGTTNDVKDNWTIGYTRNVAVGVWVGNNDGTPMVNSSGLTGAAPIWNTIMTTIYNNPSMLGAFAVNGQLLPDQITPPPGLSLRVVCNVRVLRDPSTGCPSTYNEWFLDSPAAIPDETGQLYYPPPQPSQSLPGSVQQTEPGIYRALVYRLAPEVGGAIQFNVGAGELAPPAPLYCRVPDSLIPQATGAQEQLFLAPPVTSQRDAVEAERYSRNQGLAFLPTIDCTQELLQPPIQYGPTVVTAVITSPSPGQSISGAVPITGTVQFSADQVQFYKFELLGGQFGVWTTINEVHYNPVVDGQLDVLPALPSGSYQLRLVVVDHNGGVVQQPYVVPFTVP